MLNSFLRKPLGLLQDLNVDAADDHTSRKRPKHYLVLFTQLRILIPNDQDLCTDRLVTKDRMFLTNSTKLHCSVKIWLSLKIIKY